MSLHEHIFFQQDIQCQCKADIKKSGHTMLMPGTKVSIFRFVVSGKWNIFSNGKIKCVCKWTTETIKTRASQAAHYTQFCYYI